eukprot:1158845-Pelagomonas_calceolata.AAC.2
MAAAKRSNEVGSSPLSYKYPPRSRRHSRINIVRAFLGKTGWTGGGTFPFLTAAFMLPAVIGLFFVHIDKTPPPSPPSPSAPSDWTLILPIDSS